jgi:hypothetical protein
LPAHRHGIDLGKPGNRGSGNVHETMRKPLKGVGISISSVCSAEM